MQTLPRAHLVYLSCPSRLKHLEPELMELVARQGKGGIHPFNAFPFKFYEGGVLGRDKSMEACCRIITICDEFAIFGISEGTLIEVEHYLDLAKAGSQMEFSCYIKQFDPEWETYRARYLEKFPRAITFLNQYICQAS